MNFFIPLAEDAEQTKRVYESIKAFLKKELGCEASDRKIYNLHYTHNGKKYYAEVGKKDDFIGEVVIAILYEEQRNLYHVCTPNRGVARGMSILVGGPSVLSVTDFEK